MQRRKYGVNLAAVVLAVMLLAGVAPALQAQQAPPTPNPLQVTVQNLTASRDEARAQQPSTSAQPGDTLRYVLTFTNRETRPLRNIVFDNPIPGGMVVVPASARASTEARIEFSIDGGKQFSAQPMVLVTENGRQVRRPATPESYTHVRWTLTGSVAAGASVTAQYDARVTGR